MQLKASVDYGMRIVLYLASQQGVCSSRDIAETMSIPRDYLIQLAQLLRKGGVIEARPGKNGGYLLAKDPSEISVFQVMSALDDMGHALYSKRAVREDSEVAQNIERTYELIESGIDTFFGFLTLDVLIKCINDPENAEGYFVSCLASSSRELLEQAAAPAVTNRS